ncbi:MAG: glycosyltransferase [Betaproteobacteria bacterium]|nr:glycosyltransferase [Betaproteobacteria bacterium]
MNILFVHQNFPGQYKHLAPHFAADARNRVVSIGERHADRSVNIPRIQHVLYDPPKGAAPSTHPYLRGLEAHVRRGQTVVRAGLDLRREGFVPEVICAHPGWGEALYLKEVFPESRLINFYEFYYNVQGADIGFDPEFPLTYDDRFKIPTRNATHLLSLATSDWGVSPMEWQRAQFPPAWRALISVIHDGIDTRVLRPNPGAVLKLEQHGLELSRKDEVITYVSRNLEPYRGFHLFMRALPEILRRRPKAKVLIVGGDEVSYGRKLPEGQTYRQKMLDEVGSQLDMKRVHFVGKLPYPTFIKMLQISSAHVYLTVPFVLSWSMLEAMSLGCLVIGSRTAPVQEVIEDGVNGLLVDYLSPHQIAERIEEALENRDRMQPIRQRARRTVVERYDLRTVCLPQHLALIETVRGRR